MPHLATDLRVDVPSYFKCPVSLELMRDPVSLCTGVTYDRHSIEKWLDDGHNTCPATMRVLDNQELTPNHTVRRLIQQWCMANLSKGIERISTPKPPAEYHQVRMMLDEIASGNGRLAALQRLRALAKASDRNRRCIETTRAIPVLVNLFGSEPLGSDHEIVEIIQEVVGILVLFSLDEGHRGVLLGATQLKAITWLLNRGSVDARVNAALLLETLATDRSAKVQIGADDGATQGLIGLLKEDLYPTAVKTGLKTLLALSLPLKNRTKIVEMGAIPMLVELLPGADRCMTERVMALLNGLSSCAEGRAAISGHALAIPSVVKSLLVVSDITTEHALGVLWSVCLNFSQEETLQEALQLGIFKKLLLLMQIDCTQRTKQKAKDLLRLFTKICGDNLCTSSEEN